MCCQTSKPLFKGVVISIPSSIVIVLICFTFGCDSISINQQDNNYYDARPIQTEQLNEASEPPPPCIYLEQSQELDCVCPEEYDGQGDDLITFPSTDYLKNAVHNSTIASIKLHSCQKLHLRLDLRPLARPFHRFRVEDVQDVVIEGIVLVPGDHVSMWMRNVNGTAEIKGSLNCFDCHSESDNSSLSFHLVDVKTISFNQTYSNGNQTKLKVKVRNADELTITDSYFDSLDRDAFELFNVDNVNISHCEFYHSSNEAFLLNHVQSFTASHSHMNQSLVEILDADDTLITWTCTDDDSECNLPKGVRQSVAPHLKSAGGGVSTGGAIILALVSAVLLCCIIGALILLHRMGKLDQYL